MATTSRPSSGEGDIRSTTPGGMDRSIRTDSYERDDEYSDWYNKQETMLSDVVRQDMEPLSESTDSILVFPYPPLEIADYLTRYFPPA